jgi:hypothetical protein
MLAATLAVAGTVAGVAIAATSVLGSDDHTPTYGKLTIDLSKDRAPHGGAGGGNGGGGNGGSTTTKPRVVYLKSGETQVDPVAIGTPYLDIKLTGCRKVVDGGILTQNHDIYVQGSYVANPGEYHVRIGFDDGAVAAGQVQPFTITSHLTCLKGVK